MNHSIYISILKYFITTSMSILTTNVNEFATVRENPVQYKEESILVQVRNPKQPLIYIFPIFNLVTGFCVKANKNDCSGGVDRLNLGKCKTVIYLKFRDCYLRNLPGYMKAFKLMENLNLRKNLLGTDCFYIIVQFFFLTVLDISCNSIEEIPDNILQLVNLKELSFGGNVSIYVTDNIYIS